jgi:hypothetical protein
MCCCVAESRDASRRARFAVEAGRRRAPRWAAQGCVNRCRRRCRCRESGCAGKNPCVIATWRAVNHRPLTVVCRLLTVVRYHRPLPSPVVRRPSSIVYRPPPSFRRPLADICFRLWQYPQPRSRPGSPQRLIKSRAAGRGRTRDKQAEAHRLCSPTRCVYVGEKARCCCCCCCLRSRCLRAIHHGVPESQCARVRGGASYDKPKGDSTSATRRRAGA